MLNKIFVPVQAKFNLKALCLIRVKGTILKFIIEIGMIVWFFMVIWRLRLKRKKAA